MYADNLLLLRCDIVGVKSSVGLEVKAEKCEFEASIKYKMA